jgi:hypothetical protein
VSFHDGLFGGLLIITTQFKGITVRKLCHSSPHFSD